MGLLVGDALGVPYEFHAPENLPPKSRLAFQPPKEFARSHVGVPPGTWSDDGAQALILLDSLLSCGGLDLVHFSSGLRRWLHEGFYAVNRSVFDIGMQTSSAINRLVAGVAPERAGLSDERHNGNGSLMRVLPLVLWHRGTDDDLCSLAMRQSLPTHAHPRSQIACAFYCLWARRVLDGIEDAWTSAETALRQIVDEHAYQPEIDLVLDPRNASRVSGSGYVVDTLWSAREAYSSTGNYADCVRHAVSLGHDTDTTAAVAGGIAGLRYGIADIPDEWRNNLRGVELVQPLLARLDT